MAGGPRQRPQDAYARKGSEWSSSSAGAGLAADTHVLPQHYPDRRQQQQHSNGYRGDGPPVVGGSRGPAPARKDADRQYTGGAAIRLQPSGHSTATAVSNGAATSAARRNLTRAKTLTRPDRHVQPAPLLNPHLGPGASKAGPTPAVLASPRSWWQPWSFYIHLVTFWALSPILSACGMKSKSQQRAWKEKVALCSIALVMGGFVGFATIGLNRTLCPSDQTTSPDDFIRLGEQAGYVGIQGWMFNVTSSAQPVNGINFKTLAEQLSGQDVTDLFDNSDNQPSSCNGQNGRWSTVSLCANSTSGSTAANPACVLQKPTSAYLSSLGLVNSTKRVGFSWEQVDRIPNYFVVDGSVCNMSPYMNAYPRAPTGNDTVDTVIRTVLANITASGGKDGTRLFYSTTASSDAASCIKARFRAGHIDKITPGCFASQLFLYVSLVTILAVVLARFFMALVFHWFLSAKLVQPPKNLKRHAVSPAVMPVGANTSVNNKTGTAPWIAAANAAHRANTVKKTQQNGGAKSGKPGSDALAISEKQHGGATSAGGRGPALADQNGMLSMAAIGAELFCVCLVTCYSEGMESIRTTLDSIAATDYADSRKLLFVVCDGMITGSGEKMSTPDICVSLLDTDSRFDNPQPMSYLAVSAGRKQHNQAMVYAGHYTRVKGHRTPCIIIVKTGTPEEARDPKPGNRGKRDSQMILMNFFSRVTYNDRMTPLDYDLFRKTQALMGVTPDFFEVCLMVDADTKAFPDSLKQLVNCMQHDNMIMGVCGETRIANKRQSWVTAIQVYEYYISHHLAKAFESVFGGVTCLPGCFSMYRLKARKANDTDWVPVLTQSTIVSEYSQSDVETLHEKNLLLLGEDRFLTTLMLRTFPHRKMMFCPQARCRTVAPDSFKVLLSQRRRWINSTIHNLMELVRVQDLCGTFCFSMQFVVFMDLVGTIVLPVAICLTYSLVVQSIIHPPKVFSDAIPLLLLAAVLGLPAVLILLATGKVVYVSWMLIYLVSLPIWNFVLPVYAYWHFDDFSWGQTRMVAGETKDRGHADKVGGTIEVNAVPLRRWEDWERSRLRRIKREKKRKMEFERAFGTRSYHNQNTLSTYTEGDSSRFDSSDAGSLFSSDEDRWGLQIGQYSEEPAGSLPPVGLYPVMDDGMSEGGTVDHDQMEAMLEAGWDEDDSPADLTPNGSNDGHPSRYIQPLYNSQGYPYPAPTSTPPPLPQQHMSYASSGYQYSQPPVKLYQLTDSGPVNGSASGSSSSLTRLTQDPNESTGSFASPISPRRSPLGPDGQPLYDAAPTLAPGPASNGGGGLAGYYPPTSARGGGAHGAGAYSPGRSSAYESNPPVPGKGHVKRRSGGGNGSSAFKELPHPNLR